MLSRLFSAAFTQLQALMEQSDECSLILVPSKPELQESYARAFQAHVVESGRKGVMMRYSGTMGPENLNGFFASPRPAQTDSKDREALRKFLGSSIQDFDQNLAEAISLVSVNGLFARRIRLHEGMIQDFCHQAMEYQQSVCIIHGVDLSDTSVFNLLAAISQTLGSTNDCNFCFILLYDDEVETNRTYADALRSRLKFNGVSVGENRILMPTAMEIVDFLKLSGVALERARELADNSIQHYIAEEVSEYSAGTYIAALKPIRDLIGAVGEHLDAQHNESHDSPDEFLESLLRCNLTNVHRHLACRETVSLSLAETYIGLNLLYFMESPSLRAIREMAQKSSYEPFGLVLATLYASLLASPKRELVEPMAQRLAKADLPRDLSFDAMFGCCLYSGFYEDKALITVVIDRLGSLEGFKVKGFEYADTVLMATASAIGVIIKSGVSREDSQRRLATEWKRIKDSGMTVLKHHLPRMISLFQYSVLHSSGLPADEIDLALDQLADLDFETQSLGTSPSSSIMSLMYVAGRHGQRKQYERAYDLFRQAKSMSAIFKRSENDRLASLRLWEICIRSGFVYDGWGALRYKMDGETKTNAPDYKFHALEIKTMFLLGKSSSELADEVLRLFEYLGRLNKGTEEFVELNDYVDVQRIFEAMAGSNAITIAEIANLFPECDRDTPFCKIVQHLKQVVLNRDYVSLIECVARESERALGRDAFNRSTVIWLLNLIRREVKDSRLEDIVVNLVDRCLDDFLTGWSSFEMRSMVLASRLSAPYFAVSDILMKARKDRVLAVMHKTADSIYSERDLSLMVSFALLVYSRADRVQVAAQRKEGKHQLREWVKIERIHGVVSVSSGTESSDSVQRTPGVFSEREREDLVLRANSVIGVFDVDMYFPATFPADTALLMLKKSATDERYSAYLSNQYRKIVQMRKVDDTVSEFMREKARFSKNYRDLYRLAKDREREVAVKTRDIQSILNSIQIGIFSISDAEKCAVDPDFSQHLLEILGVPTVEGETLGTILLDHCELDEYTRDMIFVCMSASIGEHGMSFEINAGQLPKELIYKRDAITKILEVDWNIVLSADDEIISKILISLRDVTELRGYQEQNRLQAQEMAIIQELVGVLPTKFSLFRKSLEKACIENERLLEAAEGVSERVVRMIYINLHTIKGNARTLGLKTLSSLVHHCEDRLQAFKDGDSSVTAAILAEDNREIRRLMGVYVDVSREKLNRAEDDTDTVSLARRDLTRIVEGLLQQQNSCDIGALVGVAFVSDHQLIHETTQDIKRLANDLHKAEPTVVCDGVGSFYFSPEVYGQLNDAFMHLLRNCMDHGIENPDERVQKGKQPAGRVEISMALEYNKLQIRLSDDGRGLALSKIRQMAVDRGVLKQDKNLSPQETAELIFSDGFSTASKVTDISGRGVGMGAVRKYIEDMGGHLEIRFTGPIGDYAPFAFVLELPRDCFVSYRKPITVGICRGAV